MKRKYYFKFFLKVSMPLLTFAFVGCGNYLAFSTATKFGLDISQRADQTADIVVGYQRAEVASIPVPKKSEEPDGIKDATDKYDAYSVLGTFAVEYNPKIWDTTKKGIEINQFFATGLAARKVADNPEMQKWFGNSLGTIKKLNEDKVESKGGTSTGNTIENSGNSNSPGG